MDFNVIVTLGPSILSKQKLREIASKGNCIFRINGAHVDPDQVGDVVSVVRDALDDAKVMMDLPGNKIRTRGLSDPISLVKGETFTLYPYQTNFHEFYQYVKAGDIIYANDSIYRLEVQRVDGDAIEILSHSDGELLNNKGLHVQGIHSGLPLFFEKDEALIEAAKKCDLDYLSLSFVRNVEDVRLAKEKVKGSGLKLFTKIETKAAVENLGYILQEVDVINVDRGDLSTDVDLLKLPIYQQQIIESAQRAGVKVFLATQFLKNMEVHPVPLISEVVDLHKTVKDGVHGIQLSEETAVGKHPVECVDLVFKVFNQSFAI